MNKIYTLVCIENDAISLCFTDMKMHDEIGDEYQVQYDTDYDRIISARNKMNTLYGTSTRKYVINTISIEDFV